MVPKGALIPLQMATKLSMTKYESKMENQLKEDNSWKSIDICGSYLLTSTSHTSHQLTLDGEENELAGWWVYISDQNLSPKFDEQIHKLAQSVTTCVSWVSPHGCRIIWHSTMLGVVSREHDSAYGGVLGATEGLLRSAGLLSGLTEILTQAHWWTPHHWEASGARFKNDHVCRFGPTSPTTSHA